MSNSDDPSLVGSLTLMDNIEKVLRPLYDPTKNRYDVETALLGLAELRRREEKRLAKIKQAHVRKKENW